MTQAAPLLANATRDLARFAAGLRFEDIPVRIVEHAKLCILDGLGVALFGAGLPWTEHVRELARAEGATAAASFWGTPYRGSVAQAALVNGTAGHAFEMDDIHKESIVHPNSLACPVAFAFAEAAGGMRGCDVLTAIVAGYEVGTRVGNAATMALFLRGFHPQGTSGVFVAAATAGRILGLPAEQMQHALGIAGSMGAGLMAAQEGAMVKRLHAGRAAQAGVQAAPGGRRGVDRSLGVGGYGDWGAAGAAGVHRHSGCAGSRIWGFSQFVLRATRRGPADRRIGVGVGDGGGRVQTVPQRDQHPHRAGCAG